MSNMKLGFIGAGTMAKAIIKGLLNAGFVSKEQVMASEVSEVFAQKASEELGVKVVTGNKAVAEFADVVFLCTKPYAVEQVVSEISDEISENTLVVSIAAGISTEKIENASKKSTPVVRVMPNTPLLVGEGMTAACKGKYATQEHINYVIDLFSNSGRCVEVQEKMINAVTGISGSGPAFMYLIIEALADGGLKLGLPKKVALELAAQTALGAAKMVLETGKHPSLLKDEVTTPGGTTIAGLMVMEEKGIRSALAKTVEETAKTAEKLG